MTCHATLTVGSSSGDQYPIALSPQLYASVLICRAWISLFLLRNITRLVLLLIKDSGTNDENLLNEGADRCWCGWVYAFYGQPACREAHLKYVLRGITAVYELRYMKTGMFRNLIRRTGLDQNSKTKPKLSWKIDDLCSRQEITSFQHFGGDV